MSTRDRPNHPNRELARALSDTADDLASWVAGHRPDRNGIDGLIGWITGYPRKGKSVEQFASWITGRRPR
jgi:hypothetical protein